MIRISTIRSNLHCSPLLFLKLGSSKTFFGSTLQLIFLRTLHNIYWSYICSVFHVCRAFNLKLSVYLKSSKLWSGFFQYLLSCSHSVLLHSHSRYKYSGLVSILILQREIKTTGKQQQQKVSYWYFCAEFCWNFQGTSF